MANPVIPASRRHLASGRSTATADRLARLASFVLLWINRNATLTFLELTLGALRRLSSESGSRCCDRSCGDYHVWMSGSQDALRVYNEFLTALLLAALVLTLSIPSLSRRFFVVAQRRVLTIGFNLRGAGSLGDPRPGSSHQLAGHVQQLGLRNLSAIDRPHGRRNHSHG